ncbi:hypothetical protein Mal15_33040 [Stieleria maiorica]|uniref:Uncharacterized protein n=1 Tax=Stieleria maiorica TaxID=2795974 RepID=A0A5B9MDB2_9BACT|nr:hypothetical protein Mal15_33040 [Stieleria maiorica]
MNASCNFITVAAMLLHSILGCSFHHACAGVPHEHGQRESVLEADACAEHGCHQHDHAPKRGGGCQDSSSADAFGAGASVALSWLAGGQRCCPKTPCRQGDSPCCSVVQCSYLTSSGIAFSLESVQVPHAWAGADASRIGTSRHGCANQPLRPLWLPDDSQSRCALHCSWQI